MSTSTLLVIDAEKIDALTTALNRVADNQDRLLAGQQNAIEKIEAGKPATTRTRKPKEKPAAAEAEEKPAAAEAVVETPAAFFTVPATVDAFKEYVGAWTGEVDKESPERAKRVDLLRAIASNFGVGAKFPELFPHVKEAVWYIERSKAGLPVDFKADVDFDSDPAIGGAAPADEDEFG